MGAVRPGRPYELAHPRPARALSAGNLTGDRDQLGARRSDRRHLQLRAPDLPGRSLEGGRPDRRLAAAEARRQRIGRHSHPHPGRKSGTGPPIAGVLLPGARARVRAEGQPARGLELESFMFTSSRPASPSSSCYTAKFALPRRRHRAALLYRRAGGRPTPVFGIGLRRGGERPYREVSL